MRKLSAGAVRIIVGLVLQGMISSSLAAAGLTVTPSVITNDYVGNIGLAITGLTAGETVRVEKFIDFNGNGVIDTNDFLVSSFAVTDGQVTKIGGVRNFNVPGDDDGLTNGQVTANVFYPAVGATEDGFSGSFIFRASDPTNGAFVPVTKPFVVLQKILPQGVSGTVTAAGSGLPVANALVALATQNGNGVIGATTDTNGNYSIYCPPNDYEVLALAPGFVSDQNAGGVTVSSNSFATLNLTNPVAANSISGKVSDSSSGAGLPGLFIQAQNNTNNYFMGTFTDGNGNYSLQVTPGMWKLKLSGDSGAGLGYVMTSQSQNVDTSGGSVTGRNFQLTKATALVCGTVKDSLSNAVTLMRMDGDDQDNVFSAIGQTDNTGRYWIGVLGSTNLNVSPDNNALAAANLIASGTNVMITNGQALDIDFVVRQVTAHLIGRLIDSNSNAVPNFTLVVFPVSTNAGAGPNLSLDTDGNGNFNIGVFGGSWNVDLEINQAAAQNLIGPAAVFNVTNSVDITNITLVAQIGTTQISGTVVDSHGAPVSGVRPFGNATNSGSTYLAGATTDTNGSFSFEVFPGTWTVGISGGDLTARGYQIVSNKTATISGTNGQTVNFTVQQQNNSPRLGKPALIGGFIQFQLTGLDGRSYVIQGNTNLSTTNWVAISTNTAFGGTFQFSDTNSSSFQHRYYRALLLP